jgi:hypothetical protein
MVRIKKIGIKQTAKFFAFFYFLVSAVFIFPIGLITLLVGSFSGQKSGVFGATFGGALLLLLPLFYAAIGAVMVATASFVYNQIAKRIGGIEIELDTETKSDTPKS